jgi:NAD(P)-dependent dehydrogenase (short-subunit alcohol dehydrogenase family)
MYLLRSILGMNLKAMNRKMNTLTQIKQDFTNNNFIIVGSPKGIGFSIAKHLAFNGAKVTLVSPQFNTTPNIFTASDTINEIVKKPSCMGVICDTNTPSHIQHVINETLDVHGPINGLVLTSDVGYLKNSKDLYHIEAKKMNNSNINGTYLFGQMCLQHMEEENTRGHLIIVAPPLHEIYSDEDQWQNHFYYTMTKMNMSLMSKYWDKEFSNISVNTMWPKISVPLPKYQEKGDYKLPEDMAKAMCKIFKTDPLKCHGNHYIDADINALIR